MKGIDKKLDDAWSLAVKVQAGFKCEYCGKNSTLNSHHVYSRSNRSVRWDLRNGYCLCVAHHTFGNISAHKSPMEFSKWMEQDRGKEWADELNVLANKTVKWMKSDKEFILQNLLMYIEENNI
jgi:hypothetical protein